MNENTTKKKYEMRMNFLRGARGALITAGFFCADTAPTEIYTYLATKVWAA